ncbi:MULTISPECIES: pilin [Vibrio]|uniref:Prepilin-type N-terminal cleavage/methylation domain-containing protein n=1 Tax=Vibrio lentus TaxID=136468 RepID=A0A2N7IKV9_9VIBR|nr:MULTISPECIES: pilin [Vibrio]PML58596.1 prepilin-type N-terminal cleavage/methylation domain-containing protein [Vibrio lentus]PMM24593.1 prepilin-type N-terminal cleavage/methylation domain-containing protein [Vibrio lentus]TCO03757.1 type IV pilus assembly protein PilA [Vibrio crassostreae]TCT54363.1 type IV pilus assembly protein PilA [Vibrio crassostreae]TCT72325.1 type IV pilus assembly protein PilA [Vibrio crassostreae]
MNNKNKRTNQKGFTLIELMIVVAVIGVLSAIAIPQYQKYVAKAEVAAALATMTGVKTNVEAYAVEYGAFPSAAQSAALGVPANIPQGTIAFAPAQSSAGSIDFTFSSSDVSSLLIASEFQLDRDSDGSWSCVASGAQAVSSDLLPKSCRP